MWYDCAYAGCGMTMLMMWYDYAYVGLWSIIEYECSCPLELGEHRVGIRNDASIVEHELVVHGVVMRHIDNSGPA